jgi:adenylate cyclase
MSAQHTGPAVAPDPPPGSGTVSADVAAELIEAALLGGPRRYTRAEVAAAVGVSPDWGRQIWRALGFADVDEDARVFTEADIAALRSFETLVASGKIKPGEEIPHVRAIGQAMSRLADWQVREMMTRITEQAGSDEAVRVALAAELPDELLPVVEQLQVFAWRRHLAAAAGRMLPDPDNQLPTATVCVGFADIVGYTRAVRHTDIDELANLLESFEENAAETVVNYGGRVVKSLGDEVLFVASTPRAAADIGVQLSGWGQVTPGLPQLRVGIALGRVLTRLGDVYGPAVNLASRLTSLAKPGTVLVDRAFAEALDGHRGYRLQARRPATVRGYHHLRSWALKAASGS